jgi:hypothetical protein
MRPGVLAHPGLAGELGVGGIVLGRGEVQRHPVDRRLDDAPGVDRPLELGAIEAFEAGGKRDVRRARLLRLQRGESLDRLGRREVPALDQALAVRQRHGQLLPGQRMVFGHVACLHAP